MLIKNGDILAIKPTLEAALGLPADKLSWRGKYYLAKLGRILSEPLKDIEATRIKLVQQYGVKTETGYAVAPGEPTSKFQAEFGGVLDIETEMGWTRITLTDKDAEALTAGEMMALDLFIAFPEPGGTPEITGDGVVKDAEAVVRK